MPAIVLGAEEVNPLEMSVAYATLASGGIYHKPLAIEKIVFPSGRVVKTKVKGKRVLSEGVAYTVNKILQKNTSPSGGTASGMSAYYRGISAGKTGTTDKSWDAWFCGYNPRLSTAVWMGYFKKNIPMTSTFGATYCVPVWGKFYNSVFGSTPIPDFVQPAVMPIWKKWNGKYSKESPSPSPSKSKKNKDKNAGDPTPKPTVTYTAKPTPTPKPTPTKTKTPTPTPTPTDTPKPVQGLLSETARDLRAVAAAGYQAP